MPVDAMGAMLKLVLTPALIAVATLLARRWGSAVGGTIAGLPLTSTPVSIFLALEQGLPFAATAAIGTLLGLLSQAAVCLAYSWTARRARCPVSVAVGVSAFFVTTLVLERVSLPLGIAFALVCTLLIGAGALIAVPPVRLAPARVPAWDLPIRMLVATSVVAVLTTIAATVGPRWTGLLSPFPVFALVLGAFTHHTEGPDAVAHLLRGVVLGSLAHATMFVLIAALLVDHGLVRTYGLATVGALAVNGLALVVVQRRR
jgi:hypothetical protein